MLEKLRDKLGDANPLNAPSKLRKIGRTLTWPFNSKEAEEVPAKAKRGRKNDKEEAKEKTDDAAEEKLPARTKPSSKKAKADVKEVDEAVDEEAADVTEDTQPTKKRKTATNGTAKKTKATAKEVTKGEETSEKRRSGRLSK